ncbi:signal transduction histidine kinase [Bradyrhizobium barranii subsp. apii]|uniref:Signal transduction histidine kinase n=1 Tax=Bradyrhizobium barranii subsp. apii TaxID=2819348 RepID=A0A8T5VN93_9BRAD|nr:signal transduction histidine kinase [Bradyrhizobium barranii]UPT88486.1 signal transduction histidine kinase [Bradyrhizobium barranii subsp. apii]
MSLTQFRVDDGPHAMDGLRLLARDGNEQIEAFMGRKVMDVWAESVEHRGGRQSLFRDQYNALGRLNLAALQRIVSAKYQRGAAFNRQHPFVEILFSDITESGEALNLSELVREALPSAFHRMT